MCAQFVRVECVLMKIRLRQMLMVSQAVCWELQLAHLWFVVRLTHGLTQDLEHCHYD